MSLESLWDEVEAEQAWREAELRFLQTQAELIEGQEEQDRFRRVLVLMLYAHFEGFCKFVLSLYIRAVNDARITCREATYAIAAAAMADLFDALRDPLRKSAVFRNELPQDDRLHKFARDREFVERSREFESWLVEVPEGVVDLEANVRPIVLRKMLYRLGLPHDMFEELEGHIHMLLNFRNKIAHGSFRDGLRRDQYQPLYRAAFQVMTSMKRAIMNAIEGKEYLQEPR